MNLDRSSENFSTAKDGVIELESCEKGSGEFWGELEVEITQLKAKIRYFSQFQSNIKSFSLKLMHFLDRLLIEVCLVRYFAHNCSL